jgi:RNA polymerase sigma factor (sigma-70 family)
MAAAQFGALLHQIHRLAAPAGPGPGADRELLEAFAARRDEAAFAALVGRHGPMVLRVCRRVLGNHHDAEDAFQATFLVLAQHGGSIRKRDTVGGWLDGVAYRTAMRAKRSAARRRQHEARVVPPAPLAAPGPSWGEVQAALDEELQRLPERVRAAFVFHVLEGMSGPEAAAALGCKEGTLKSRVNRARRSLQRQLARRRIQLAALLAALAVAESPGRAALPAALARATVRFGLLVAAGGTAAGTIPLHVASLATGVTRAMFLTKAKIVTAVLLVVALAVAGTGAVARQVLATREGPAGKEAPAAGSPVPGPAAARETKKSPAADDPRSIAYGGRVLGPDGRPVAGAKVHMTLAWGYPHRPSPSPEYARTGPDGRFRFTASRAEFGDYYTVVAAAAANYGAGWEQVSPAGRRDDLTIRLVEDDVPIIGTVVNLEGKPVPGVTLTVLQINAAMGEDLGPWLEAVRAKKGLSGELEQQYLHRYTIALPLKATTDAAGRLRLTGIGRNRLVRAQLDGPTIASQPVCVLTRPGESNTLTEWKGNPEYGEPRRVTDYHAANFRVVAGPTQPVVGVVRDKDTKKPLAGATVGSMTRVLRDHQEEFDIVRTTADAQGRYRLVGLPKGGAYKIVAIPAAGQPYLATNRDVPSKPGLDAVTVDFDLKRGVWIEGKLIDKVTGKPLRGAVEYFSLYRNPNLKDYPGFDGTFLLGELTAGSKEDGSYRVIGLPGSGLVGVYYQKDSYLRANDRDDEFGTKERSLETAPYHISFTTNYNAIARIDPPKGADVVKRDITLDPGWTFTAKVEGPDGKPLPGARALDLNRGYWWGEPMRTAEYRGGVNPRRPSAVAFQHPDKGLVGVAPPPKKNGGSVSVRMGPAAAVAGRLVNAAGRARPGVELWVTFAPEGRGYWMPYSLEPVRTDREGRFRIATLLPGKQFRLSDERGGEAYFGDGLRPGETKDLGDVRMQPIQKEE